MGLHYGQIHIMARGEPMCKDMVSSDTDNIYKIHVNLLYFI